MIELFGAKTTAAFDLWSLEHFFTGANVAIFGGKMRRRFNVCNDNPRLFVIAFVLICELFWEVVEHYLEAGAMTMFPRVEYWFHGVEAFVNRAISDPLMTVAGGFFIMRFPKWKIFCVLFSTIWVTVHVFFFPHCMYSQEWLAHKLWG